MSAELSAERGDKQMNKSNKVFTVMQLIIAVYLLTMCILFVVSSVGLLRLNMSGDGMMSQMIILICAIINIRPENQF